MLVDYHVYSVLFNGSSGIRVDRSGRSLLGMAGSNHTALSHSAIALVYNDSSKAKLVWRCCKDDICHIECACWSGTPPPTRAGRRGECGRTRCYADVLLSTSLLRRCYLDSSSLQTLHSYVLETTVRGSFFTFFELFGFFRVPQECWFVGAKSLKNGHSRRELGEKETSAPPPRR